MKALECRWNDVLVKECEARYAHFNDGVIRDSEFESTQLQDFRRVSTSAPKSRRWGIPQKNLEF